MSILAWIIVGAVAGWLASVIMRTNSSQGLFLDILLGVIGAFVGGVIMNLAGFSGATGFNLYTLAVATLGAVVLIALGRALFHSSSTITR